MSTFLKKVGIKIQKNARGETNAVRGSKRVILADFDRNDIYDKIIWPLGIRKTKGRDFFDGKKFIEKEPLIKALMKYRENYSVTFKFKFLYQEKKDKDTGKWTREIKDYVTITYNSHSKKTPNREKLQRAAEEYLEEIRETWMYDYEVTEILPPQVFKLEKVKSLENHTAFGSRLAYPNMLLTPGEWTGTCCYDFLLKNYPRKAQSIEHLEDFFMAKRSWGLSPRHFMKFAEHHNLGCYISDLLGECVVKRTSTRVEQKRMKETHPIMGVIANDHFYEISQTLRKKMNNIIRGECREFTGDLVAEHKIEENDRMVKYHEKIPDPESLTNLNTIHCVPVKDLSKMYTNLLKKGQVYPSKWKGEKVTDIYLSNNCKISVSPNYDVVKALCKDFGEYFENQSLPALARQLWKDFEGTWKQSVFANEVKKLYHNNKSSMWVSAFHYLRDPKNLKSSYKIAGVDQAKQYTSICLKGGFFTHDILDQPIEYNTKHKITYGMYYVETDRNLPPFKKSGFYDYKIVQGALMHGIITHDNITCYIPGHDAPDNDKKLKAFIEYAYAQSSQAKHIVNMLIGGFGIVKTRKESKTIITVSPYEANYYRTKLGDEATIRMIDNDIYKVQGYNEVIQMSSDAPIRLQIVNRGNWEAYKMMLYVKKSGAIIMGVKTDCVLYAYDPKRSKKVTNAKTAEIGGYRDEKKAISSVAKFKEVYARFKDNESYRNIRPDFQYTPREYIWNCETADPNEYFDHERILRYNRVYVKGFAGSGKSYIIDQLRKELGGSFLYVSFTHMAANNIDGQTICSAFGINFNMNDAAYDKTLRKVLKEYTGIIIDEVNQVPLTIFRILCQLPSDFKIYAFGDHRQEPPVEPTRSHENLYIESNMFMSLMYNNMIELSKQCRADAEFANACAEYHDKMEEEIKQVRFALRSKYLKDNPYIQKDILAPFVKEWSEYDSGSIDDDINIVKTNALRVFINHEKMLEHKDKNSPEIRQTAANVDGQVMWLYKGLPLVANKTMSKLGILHNELYEVESFDGIRVVLKYKMLNFGVKYIIKRIEKRFIMWIDQIGALFSPGYAFTTYKAEGQTISLPHTIYEFNRMYHKSRYTAITRTSDSKLVTIKNMIWQGHLPDEVANHECYEKNVCFGFQNEDKKIACSLEKPEEGIKFKELNYVNITHFMYMQKNIKLYVGYISRYEDVIEFDDDDESDDDDDE
jgi:AAA domain